MATYRELLKHPMWQRKRLEILERDNYTCQWCADKETTLHVHHVKYRSGAKPWEYAGSELVTVCEICHAEHRETMDRLSSIAGAMSPYELRRTLGYASALVLMGGDDRLGSIDAPDYHDAMGIADLLRIEYEEVERATTDGVVTIHVLREIRERRLRG